VGVCELFSMPACSLSSRYLPLFSVPLTGLRG
jgi:hypothetical protein